MLYVFLSLSSFAFGDALLPQVPEGVQAMSLSGEPLVSAEPSVNTLNNLARPRRNTRQNRGLRKTLSGMAAEPLTQGIIAAPLRYSRRGSKSFPRIPGSSGIAAIVIFPSASSIMPLPIWSGRRI